MSDLDLVWWYTHLCATGVLRLWECVPVWQLGAIVFLLCVAVISLVVIRARATPRASAR